MTCPGCGAALAAGDRFCADCGRRIAPADPPVPGARNEAVGPGLAARSDPGRSHVENQDAFRVSGPPAGGPGTILVVCDGVSRSQTPAVAAAAAARAAHGRLASPGEAEAAMREAILAAHDAVCALPFDRQSEIDPPASTIVAARIDADGATVGWLGDSRAYWLAARSRALTRDHSWMEDALARGADPAEAAADARAHALLHCLGTTDFSHATPCPVPGIARLGPEEGWLLLCSDGLWNYLPDADALAALAGAGDADGICAALVGHALAAGGHDNVTVAVARLRTGP